MSFGLSAAAWTAIFAGTTAAVAVSQADTARRVGNEAKDRAKAQADLADQNFNKLNGKKPDLAALLDQSTQAGKSGPSGTLLTGPQGIDPSKLLLGRSTLLGATGG